MLYALDVALRTSLSRVSVMKKPVVGSVSGMPSELPPIDLGPETQVERLPSVFTLRQSVWLFVMRVKSTLLNCGSKPTKNHSLSLMIGPPRSKPKSAL